MVYYSLEPFGEAQQEYRAALVASTVANTARDTEKRRSPFTAEEFMRPGYIGEAQTEQDETEMLMAKMGMIAGLFGAKK